jgi:succinate-semialdehyde dehydrogenase / glutarate-semialdehyde dehydrogenase
MQTREVLLQTVNPATGEILNDYPVMSIDGALRVVEAVHAAFALWRLTPVRERCDLVAKLGELLLTRKQQLAVLIANEMGKPIKQGIAEIEKCAKLCSHYAEAAESYLTGREIASSASKSFVMHEPLGVVLGIMPWNYPFWQVFRFAIPALIAGNGALLKHAAISTGAALDIETLFEDAGFPESIFRTLIITNEEAESVIAHPHVAAVTFTGSVAAGRIIAAQAGKFLKKTVLELGGSDPYVILADADLEMAAEACVNSRLLNAGQSCIAAKRLIVVESVQPALVKLIQEKIKVFKPGAPLDEATTLGPLAREDIRDSVHQQVLKTVEAGATLLTGGYIPKSHGFYYPPTILTDVPRHSPAAEQEIFGPVIAIMTAKDEEEAIALANQTSFGLGAAVFTKDLARGELIAAKQLHAGICVVNMFVASDPRLPFGGIKHSGYGRELSMEGILSFVNTKTVMIR